MTVLDAPRAAVLETGLDALLDCLACDHYGFSMKLAACDDASRHAWTEADDARDAGDTEGEARAIKRACAISRLKRCYC